MCGLASVRPSYATRAAEPWPNPLGRVVERIVRVTKGASMSGAGDGAVESCPDRLTPHPALRATFSRREKES